MIGKTKENFLKEKKRMKKFHQPKTSYLFGL